MCNVLAFGEHFLFFNYLPYHAVDIERTAGSAAAFSLSRNFLEMLRPITPSTPFKPTVDKQVAPQTLDMITDHPPRPSPDRRSLAEGFVFVLTSVSLRSDILRPRLDFEAVKVRRTTTAIGPAR